MRCSPSTKSPPSTGNTYGQRTRSRARSRRSAIARCAPGLPVEQDRARHDLQAGRSRREELAAAGWSPPLAEGDPQGHLHRWHREDQPTSSSRCRLTPTVTNIRRYLSPSWPGMLSLRPVTLAQTAQPDRTNLLRPGRAIRCYYPPQMENALSGVRPFTGRSLGRLLRGPRGVALAAHGELLIGEVAKLPRDRLTCRLVVEIDRRRRADGRAERALVDHPDQHPFTHCSNPPVQ